MSTVVRRCPNCGSVQDDGGVCDVCHEADVRWFCPNHTPGRWLDAPACAACGATEHAGPTVARPAPVPPRPAPAPPRPAPLPTRPVPRPRERAHVPVRERPHALPAEPPTHRGRRTRRSRHATPADVPVGWPGDPSLTRRVVRVGVPTAVGCVGRLLLLALILLAMLAAAFAYVVWY